jgi:hypothetical protein
MAAWKRAESASLSPALSGIVGSHAKGDRKGSVDEEAIKHLCARMSRRSLADPFAMPSLIIFGPIRSPCLLSIRDTWQPTQAGKQKSPGFLCRKPGPICGKELRQATRLVDNALRMKSKITAPTKATTVLPIHPL